MINYHKTPPQEVESVWFLVEKWIKVSMLDDVTMSSDDLQKLCAAGRAELWLIYENNLLTGCLIGWVIKNPRGSYYFASILGGEGADKWAFGAYEALKLHAKSLNCTQLDMVGRPAWQKLFGIKPKGCYYSVNL